MKKFSIIFGFLLWLPAMALWASRVDTIMVKSPSMEKEVKVVFIVSDKAIERKACPVIYLLHGYAGSASSWIKLKPELPRIADEKGLIFVCPDGKNSWYWNSPKDATYQYETFISSELVEYTDAHYATIPQKKARAISGFSMGGHGAMWNAIRHKDVFGAAGSMSGGVDIRPFPRNWEMSKQLGEKTSNEAIWEAHTVVNQLDKIENRDIALIIDCGENDFFSEVNKDLHKRLLDKKIDHDFISRPGGHNRPYWKNSIDYHILFFDSFFKK